MKKVDLIEKKEIEAFYKMRNDLILVKLENLSRKHELEKKAFQKKSIAESEELTKQRNVVKEQIILKFKNKKFDLTTQQKQEDIMNENDKISRRSLKFY